MQTSNRFYFLTLLRCKYDGNFPYGKGTFLAVVAKCLRGGAEKGIANGKAIAGRGFFSEIAASDLPERGGLRFFALYIAPECQGGILKRSIIRE